MDEASIKRVMPHSIESEQAVIGSMLTDRLAIDIASEILTQDDFYGKQYGIIFTAMVSLNNEKKSVDPVTLQDRLREMDVPEEIKSMEFLKDVLNVNYLSANIRQYCESVKNRALARKLIRITDGIQNRCYESKENINSIFETTEKEVFELVQRRNTGDYKPINQAVLETLKEINEASKRKGDVTGIASGFTDLDYLTAGFKESEFILIAARPAMGKTAFVLNIADYVCFKNNQAAVIFSLEMSESMLVKRLISQESNVDSQHIRTGNLQDHEWDAIMEASAKIADSNLIIDTTPAISIGELMSKCRKYKLEKDIQIIFIDYLQLMTSGTRNESRQQEVSTISRQLKALARELHVPVVALSQLSRQVEQRENHRPVLSDLRESGAIEQDADVVMFLYRDEYYNKDTEKKNIGEVIIAKQRSGSLGTVELVWLGQYTRFVNKEKSGRRDNY